MNAYFRGARSQASDTASQIARLKAQVDALSRDSMVSTVSNLREPANEAMREALDTVRYRGRAMMGTIRDQPIAAVAVAAVVAFFLGRMTR